MKCQEDACEEEMDIASYVAHDEHCKFVADRRQLLLDDCGNCNHREEITKLRKEVIQLKKEGGWMKKLTKSLTLLHESQSMCASSVKFSKRLFNEINELVEEGRQIKKCKT